MMNLFRRPPSECSPSLISACYPAARRSGVYTRMDFAMDEMQRSLSDEKKSSRAVSGDVSTRFSRHVSIGASVDERDEIVLLSPLSSMGPSMSDKRSPSLADAFLPSIGREELLIRAPAQTDTTVVATDSDAGFRLFFVVLLLFFLFDLVAPGVLGP